MDDPFDPEYHPWQKKRHSAFSLVTVGVGSTPLVGASQKRVGLVLTGNSAGEVQYAPVTVAFGHASINLPAQSSPLILDEAIVGDIVKKAWAASMPVGGPSTVGVIEIMTD